MANGIGMANMTNDTGITETMPAQQDQQNVAELMKKASQGDPEATKRLVALHTQQHIQQNYVTQQPQQTQAQRPSGPSNIVKVVDAWDNGTPTKAYQTSDGRFLKIDEAQSEIQAGTLLPPTSMYAKAVQPVQGIGYKIKTPEEAAQLNTLNTRAQNQSNIQAATASAKQYGFEPEGFAKQLEMANLTGTPEGEAAQKQYNQYVQGIRAPNEDVQRRIGFLTGPATQTALEMRKREMAQAGVAGVPEEYNKPVSEYQKAVVGTTSGGGLAGQAIEGVGAGKGGARPIEDIEKEQKTLEEKGIAQEEKVATKAEGEKAKQDQKVQTQWEKLQTAIDADKTSGRTGLGWATKANRNVALAKGILNRSIVTGDEYVRALSLLEDAALSGGQIGETSSTLAMNVAKEIGFWTSKPTNVISQQRKDRLISELNDVQNQARQTLTREIKLREDLNPFVLENPEYAPQWTNMKKDLNYTGISAAEEGNQSEGQRVLVQGLQGIRMAPKTKKNVVFSKDGVTITKVQ